MFARWVKSLIICRCVCSHSIETFHLVVYFRSTFAILFFFPSFSFLYFVEAHSLIMIPQESNICFNHVHSDLIWPFFEVSPVFFIKRAEVVKFQVWKACMLLGPFLQDGEMQGLGPCWAGLHWAPGAEIAGRWPDNDSTHVATSGLHLPFVPSAPLKRGWLAFSW